VDLTELDDGRHPIPVLSEYGHDLRRDEAAKEWTSIIYV
jgi:hypothetical protein